APHRFRRLMYRSSRRRRSRDLLTSNRFQAHLLSELPQLPCESFDIACRGPPAPAREQSLFFLERQHVLDGFRRALPQCAILRNLPFEFLIRSRDELFLVADQAEVSPRPNELCCCLLD